MSKEKKRKRGGQVWSFRKRPFTQSSHNTLSYMSCGLHNSPRSSHLSSIAVGMAKVLVCAMVVETVEKFGYDTKPRHILLQMIVFIRQIKQVAFIQIFFGFGWKDIGWILGARRATLNTLVIRGVRGGNGRHFAPRGGTWIRSFDSCKWQKKERWKQARELYQIRVVKWKNRIEIMRKSINFSFDNEAAFSKAADAQFRVWGNTMLSNSLDFRLW